jgi:hypothetical protein
MIQVLMMVIETRWRSLSAEADAFARAKASPTRWQRLRFALTERKSISNKYYILLF